MFLVDRGARIVFANTRGQAMLAEGTFVVERVGALHAVAAEADRAVLDSLRTLEGRDVEDDNRRTAIRLSGDPDRNWTAHVLPLMDGTRRKAGSAYEAVAAVFVQGSSLADKTPLEALMQLYVLTVGEIRVVAAVLRTDRLDDIAAALGISRATVKTHLNRVYRKCGVTGQGGLIRLVSDSARYNDPIPDALRFLPLALHAQARGQVAAIHMLAEMAELAVQIDEDLAAHVAPAPAESKVVRQIAADHAIVETPVQIKGRHS